MDKNKRLQQFCKEAGWSWFFSFTFKKHARETHKYFINPVSSQEMVFIGDSRISGGRWAENIKIDVPVVNIGIGGTRATEWSKHLSLQYVISRNPAKILIGLGANDLGSGESDQKIMGDMHKIAWAFNEQTSAKIYIHCILPIIVHGKADNSDVKRINKLLKIMCTINEYEFIDFFDDFNEPKTGYAKIEYLNTDEIPQILWDKIKPVHYNEQGYKHWYTLLNKKLKEI